MSPFFQFVVAWCFGCLVMAFLANWLLAQIDVGDNKADAWKSLLIGLVFAGISYLTVREV